MSLEDDLKAYGLHRTEIRVYLYLLENGLSTPPAIAKGTGIARTNCYGILRDLKEKGLLHEQEKKKKKAYLAADPESLLRSLEEKKELVSRILPDLRGLYTVQKNKPKIKFYEGFDQVKQVYWLTLSVREKKIYAIGSTKELSDLDPHFFRTYTESMKERGILLQDILSHDSGIKTAPDTQKIMGALYDVKLLPPKYQELPTDVLLWDEHIALVTLREPIFATVLTSPLLAKTFRIIVSILWDAI
ncbi:MAG: helix-turn-helix domain-containing protein [Patescibacteria group bacterium]